MPNAAPNRRRMLGEWELSDAPAVKQWMAVNQAPDYIRQRFSR